MQRRGFLNNEVVNMLLLRDKQLPKRNIDHLSQGGHVVDVDGAASRFHFADERLRITSLIGYVSLCQFCGFSGRAEVLAKNQSFAWRFFFGVAWQVHSFCVAPPLLIVVNFALLLAAEKPTKGEKDE